ncbi:MAG: TatD family hydrolase [Chthoniobacterales bacterium]
MLIDTHAHLDYPDYKDDFDAMLQRARDAGVERIVTIGTGLESGRRVIALAERVPMIYAAVGVHPVNVADEKEDFIEDLREIAKHPKIAAIGEIGLDYHHLPSKEMQTPFQDIYKAEVAQDPNAITAEIADQACKNAQKAAFEMQLDLAVELGLNVVIHQRDAWEDTLDILDAYTGKLRAVYHCFGGTPEQAAEVIAMGHLVSFTGIVTFKNAQGVRDTAANLPPDRFMVETDCPYLAPPPYRGKRCEPAYTRLVAEKLSEVRREDYETLCANTTRTAEHFFRFTV